METYRIVRSPLYSRAQLALAPRYSELADAMADMGDGIVLGNGERLVAFHVRHLALVERMAQQMTGRFGRRKCGYEITLTADGETESAYCGKAFAHAGEHGVWER